MVKNLVTVLLHSRWQTSKHLMRLFFLFIPFACIGQNLYKIRYNEYDAFTNEHHQRRSSMYHEVHRQNKGQSWMAWPKHSGM